jgi:hypothetical protein
MTPSHLTSTPKTPVHPLARSALPAAAGSRRGTPDALLQLIDGTLMPALAGDAQHQQLSGLPLETFLDHFAELTRLMVAERLVSSEALATAAAPLAVYCQFPWAAGVSRWWLHERTPDTVLPSLEVAVLCDTWEAWPALSGRLLRQCTMPIIVVDPATGETPTREQLPSAVQKFLEALAVSRLQDRIAALLADGVTLAELPWGLDALGYCPATTVKYLTAAKMLVPGAKETSRCGRATSPSRGES